MPKYGLKRSLRPHEIPGDTEKRNTYDPMHCGHWQPQPEAAFDSAAFEDVFKEIFGEDFVKQNFGGFGGMEVPGQLSQRQPSSPQGPRVNRRTAW